MNLTVLLRYCNFDSLNFTSFCRDRSTTLDSVSSCSASSTPPIELLSKYTSTPGCLRKSSPFAFETTQAHYLVQMEHGSNFQRYLPKGVMKVVKSALSSSNSICQNPLLQSKMVNTDLPESRLIRSSVVGMRKCSRSIHLFSALGSQSADSQFSVRLFNNLQIIHPIRWVIDRTEYSLCDHLLDFTL